MNTEQQRLPAPLQVLLWAYVPASLTALAAALTDPSDDPLAAVFLVLVAAPWIWALDWVNATIGADSRGLNVAFACLGVVVNATLPCVPGWLVAARSA